MHFVELQNLQRHRAMDEKSFYINDDVFLATASQPAESFIKVGIEVSLSYLRHYPTYIYEARALHSLVMYGQTFLGAANQY